MSGFDNPRDWDLEDYVILACLSLIAAPVWGEDENGLGERWSSGHRIVIGVAVVQVALFIHFTVYPETISVVLVEPLRYVGYIVATGAAVSAESLRAVLPAVNWEVYHITGSMVLLPGFGMMASGLVRCYIE